MGCTWFKYKFRRSRSVPAATVRVPTHASTTSLGARTPMPSSSLAPAPPSATILGTPGNEFANLAPPQSARNEPDPAPTSSAKLKPPGPLTLWEQALSRLQPDDKTGVDLNEDAEPGKLLRNLIDATEQKKAEIEANKWVYLNSRGEKVSYADTFLTVLNKYVGIVDIAIQHDPHVVALVWSGFRLLLQVATADRENVQMIFGSLEGLVRILLRCDIYERLYAGRSLQAAEQLNASLVNLYVAVLQYLCSARRQISRDTTVRILKSLVSDSGELFNKIQECEKEVQKDAETAEKEAAGVESYVQEKRTDELKSLLAELQEPIKEIACTVTNINVFIKGEQRCKILEWLSLVPYQDHHILSQQRREEGTGGWLLQHGKFCEWRKSTASSMLWLRGNAGTGKTILASKVIDEFRLEPGRHALAYFYCYFGEEERKTPASILRALVKQLCLVDHGEQLPEPVLSLYTKRNDRGQLSGELHPSESRDLIIELSTGFQQTTIVVDALDECDAGTRETLFLILKQIVTSTERVRIFVTSRNHEDIQRMLGDFPSHYLDATDNIGDIKSYIKSELDRCSARKPLLADPALRAEIVATLEKGADGMFMWVYLQIQAICREHTPRGVRAALATLPKGLDATYNRILENIEIMEGISAVRPAHTVLKWVLYSQRLVQAAVIVDTLRVIPGEDSPDTFKLEPDTILDICQNLVVYDPSVGALRFAHFSVQEFLIRHPEFQPELEHTAIAEVCLTFLLYQPKVKMSFTNGFLDYCFGYWGDHTRLSGGGSKMLEGLWKRFLTPPLEPPPAYIEWATGITAWYKWNEKFEQLIPSAGVIAPVFAACFYQLSNITEFLLDSGGSLECRNRDGDTPLTIAVVNGLVGFVPFLIDRNVDLNARNKAGDTPLLLALKRSGAESLRTLKILLATDGVDLDYQDSNGRPAISHSASRGLVDVVEALLRRGAAPDARDESGQTALTYAAVGGHIRVVQMLLETGRVDAHSRDEDGRTDLSHAAQFGGDSVVQMLLDNGADLKSLDKNGRTALSHAAEGSHELVVETLLRHGADLELSDKNGRTPLSHAAGGSHELVVEALLRHGADLESSDKNGRTPLSYAAQGGHVSVAQTLLDNGADMKSLDSRGRTPLLHAAQVGRYSVAQTLLDNGADPESSDENGRTPLSHAAQASHYEVVRILLDNGADPQSLDSGGRTPYSWASNPGQVGTRRRGWEAVMGALLSRMN